MLLFICWDDDVIEKMVILITCIIKFNGCEFYSLVILNYFKKKLICDIMNVLIELYDIC